MHLFAKIILISLISINPVSTDPLDTALSAVQAALDTEITGWEMRVESPDGEISSTGAWRSVTLGHRSREKQVRYRTTVTVPAVAAGTRITGGKAELQLAIGGPADYSARVFVDGKQVMELPARDPDTGVHLDVPPVLLSNDIQAGQSWDIEIIVHNRMIYPPHEFLDSRKSVTFSSARLVLEQAAPMTTRLTELRANLLAGKYLSQPWQPNPADKRPFVPERKNRSRINHTARHAFARTVRDAVTRLDLHALEEGRTADLGKSIDSVMTALKPASAYAKQFTVYLVGNAHIDLAWLWRTNETVKIAANTFRSVLNNMAVHPELVYAQSQAQAYQWVEKTDPQLFEDIRAAVRSGHWDIVGGMWSEPDCNLPGGESWVRHILYAQEYFQDRFGVAPWLGWNPDSFGYNANMPQLFSRAGLKAFITQKISWNHETRFPWHLFWWEAADGSRILTYFPTGSYVEKVEPERMLNQLLDFEHATGFKETLALIGFGNHGGGPNLPMLERAEMLSRQPAFPNVAFIRPHDYIELMMQKDLSDLPVWKGELYLENHRGTYTTQSDTKRNNRELEGLLETSEKAAAAASLFGLAYPSDDIERAWRTVLLNQFHDILPGSSITPVYYDAARTYAQARTLADRALHRSLTALVEKLGFEREGWRTVAVFNPLSWERDGIVRVPLEPGSPPAVRVIGPAATEIPSSIVTSDDGLQRHLLFNARSVPSVGLKRYVIEAADAPAKKQNVAQGTTIENEFLIVEVNAETGNISRIYDKVNGWEVLASGAEGNVIELHENLPSFWDAWNIGYSGRMWTVDKADSVEVIEANAVRSVIRVKKSFRGLSKVSRAPTEDFPSTFFVQDIILYSGRPAVDVSMRIDWWEDHTLLKVAFPLAVHAPKATYEIPYGTIERSTARETLWEQARFEVPVHRWADISDGEYGVSLLNDSKYGMDIHGNVMRLTLLTSPLWPDPMADRGIHRINFAVYPHAGDWRDAGTVQLAQELNMPMRTCDVAVAAGGKYARLQLPSADEIDTAEAQVMMSAGGLVFVEDQQAPALSLEGPFSLASIDAGNVVISTLKRAEDGDGIVIRFVETEGRETDCTVTLATTITGADEVDLRENHLAAAKLDDGRLVLQIKPYEIRSFIVRFGTAE
jgi:alpha-mannosidase